MTSKLKAALELARRGLHVFPCRPNDKRPAISGWQDAATTDEDAIRAWWTDGPDRNIGVYAHKSGLFVLDVDVKGGVDGFETLQGLELANGDLPPTFAVDTPTGGRHLYYAYYSGNIPNSTGLVGPGLDVRGRGGYVLGPGSTIDGNSYRASPGRTGDTYFVSPLWLIEAAKPVVQKAKETRLPPLADDDSPGTAAWVRQYLSNTPGAEEGGRNDRLLKVAADLKDQGVSSWLAADVLQEWNDRAMVPPLDREEVTTTVLSAYRNTQNRQGSKSPAAVFASIPEPPKDPRGGAAQSPAPDPEFPDPVNSVDLRRRPLIPTSYVWDPWIIEGIPNLLIGNGGLGKSLLALLLSSHVAEGTPLFGGDTTPRDVLYLTTEEPEEKVNERFDLVARRTDREPQHDRFDVWSLAGYMAPLARISDDGSIESLPFLARLERELRARPPGLLLVLDCAHDLVRMNGNLVEPVHAFSKGILHPLCRAYGITILLLHHPSQAGMKEGRDYGGSVSWNNAFRNRLAFKAPDNDPQAKVRTLSVGKRNWGRRVEQPLQLLVADDILVVRGEATPAQRHGALPGELLSLVSELVGRGERVLPHNNGDGILLRDLVRLLDEHRGLSSNMRDVGAALTSLRASGQLRYREPTRHTKASLAVPESPFEGVPEAPDEAPETDDDGDDSAH